MQPLRNVTLFIVLCHYLSTGCNEETSSDPPTTEFSYDDGLFVANQGPFGSGTGTLTYYSTDTVIAEAYSTANTGEPLGNIVQSTTVIDTVVIVTVNNADKVVAASTSDLTKMYEITVPLPRYTTSLGNGLAAISYWGEDGFSGGVAIINIHTGEVVDDVSTGNAPERMMVRDGDLWVAMSRGFSIDNRVARISLSDYSVLEYITVFDHPHTFVVDRLDRFYVICGGFTDSDDPDNNRTGGIVDLENQAGITVRNFPEQAAISSDRNTIYLLGSDGLAIQPAGEPTQDSTLISGPYYALGVQPVSGNIYLANAGDFTSPGSIEVYNIAGQPVETLPAGVIPGDIHFIDQ